MGIITRPASRISERLASKVVDVLPWFMSSQYAATATDGSTVYPTWLFDGLNWRFAKSSSPTGSVSQVAFSGLLENFTRASSATYLSSAGVPQTAGPNVPRFTHDPATLQPLGMLVESAATNAFLFSDDFANAYWSKTGGTLTSNTMISPDGTLNADTLTTSGGVGCYLNRLITPVVSVDGTLSVFVKAGTSDSFGLQLNNATSFPGQSGLSSFILTTETVTPASGVTAGMQKLQNGWYRLWVKGTASATSTSTQMRIYLFTNGGTGAPSAGETGHFYGAQFETGSNPTSYIPTAGSTVTRAQDVAGTTDLSWYNSTDRKGTFIVEAKAPDGASTFDRILQLDDGTNNNYIAIQRNGTDLRFTVVSGGVTQANTLTNGFTNGMVAKIGVSFEDNNVRVVMNAGSEQTDISCTMPSGLTNARVGGGVSTSDYFNSTIARAYYYTQPITTSEIQRLTT